MCSKVAAHILLCFSSLTNNCHLLASGKSVSYLKTLPSIDFIKAMNLVITISSFILHWFPSSEKAGFNIFIS